MTKFIINGKEYARIEDVPAEIRALLKAGGPVQVNRSYTVNGKTYDRLEDVPSEFRQFLQDRDKNGIPDIAERPQPPQPGLTLTLGKWNLTGIASLVLMLLLAITLVYIFMGH